MVKIPKRILKLAECGHFLRCCFVTFCKQWQRNEERIITQAYTALVLVAVQVKLPKKPNKWPNNWKIKRDLRKFKLTLNDFSVFGRQRGVRHFAYTQSAALASFPGLFSSRGGGWGEGAALRRREKPWERG